MLRILAALSLIVLISCNRTASKLNRELSLEDVNGAWVLQNEHSTQAVPQIDLYFNQPVSPEALKKKLKVELEGAAIPYLVQTSGDNSRISLRLQGITPADRDLASVVVIEKGLAARGDSATTTETIRTASTIPSPFNLVLNNIDAEHDGMSGSLFVRTSQQVRDENISGFIKIEPAVKFTVSKTDNGFVIKSPDFDAEKNYLLTVSKGMHGLIGGELQEEYENNIAFGELQPSVQISSPKSVFLSARGNRALDIRIVNIEKVKVIISKIYESNLLASQQYGYYPKDDRNESEDEEYYYDYSSNDGLTNGDVIFEQEVDTRSLPELGNSKLFTFNVDDKLSEFKGIYHIKVRSLKDYWISDSRFISVSDLGLIAKEGSDRLFVFANSIKTSETLNGVNIVAYGNNNQVLGIGTTNNEGVAEIPYTRKEFAGFRPAMIVAKTEKDFNYLPFRNTQVNTSRFEVGGRRTNSTGLDAFIYAERDIYRPGEKVNFSMIVRDRLWKSPGELPVIMKFILPNGKELKTFRKTLNEEGSADGSVDISTAAITGSYNLELYTSNNVLLGSKSFSIEEFVPDRIKVSAQLDQTVLAPGNKVNLAINATNFFGPPAANRNYETEIQVNSRYFSPAKFPKYDFGIHNQGLSLDKVVREGKTDEKGSAEELYEVPEVFKNNGVLQAAFYTTVFDETGRPVSRVARADIFTQPVFFGIADDGNWYYPLNQPAKFPLIAVDKNEKAVSGARALVRMIRHEYKTVLSKSGSYFRYDSQEEEKILNEQNISIGGEGTSYSFTPRSPGNYEIRVSVPGAPGYVSRNFYSYGAWGGDNGSFEVNTEGSIDIETDKSVYSAGETAKILFKTPFDGRMLVTLEQDRVVYHQYVEVQKRNASLDIRISAEHLPNVFVTATLIKPHGISEIPLTAAHGFQNLKVEDRQRRNTVEILAAKASRSRTRQQVTVKAEPGSLVTLAAVDNGVLQVSGFQTPDPYEFFYSPRALEVQAYDLYPFLFPELRARLSSTGGDGMDMEKRMNPMPAKRIQILSYWSGISKTNGDGQAKFNVDIPEFSGEVRLMAVAYKGNQFGAAESVMKVADPMVLSTALPRFLSPGDTLTVPVTLTNTTAKAAEASAIIRSSGPIKIIGEGRQTLPVAANAESRAVFHVIALPSVDTGRIYVDVNALGEKFSSQTALGVRPASPLQFRTGSGSLKGGESRQVSIGGTDFLAGSARSKLVLSKSPVLDIGEQLRFLVQYPYGCTEQTISSAFPQLYYADLVQQFVPSQKNTSAASENVQEAIRKIKLRQLYNGAVTLWDGEGTENWWSSIYAAHFLWEAQKAGFDVDQNLLNGLLNYITSRLRNKQTITYYYNRDKNKKIAPKEVAYSLYVLALASRPNVSAMNYYKANPALLSLDSKYLLSVSYAIAGDNKRFREMLPASFSGEVSVPETGGSFSSPIRDEAIALNALIEVDPSNSQIPLMAKHVSEQLKQRSWYSTQECAFSFLALGKLTKAANASSVKADVKVNGKKIASFEGKDLSLSQKQLGGSELQISGSGDGRIYYYWQTEGISVSGQYKEEDNFIKIRRQFYDRYGRKISGNTFRQNDLVIVQLTLENSYNTTVENIAITDILPAGFEIENPRTKDIPGMEWIKDASTPTQLDVRDDRINLFVDLESQKQVYYYAVRAVSPGNFVMGPVAADAMYNAEYHSYHGAGTIRIE